MAKAQSYVSEFHVSLYPVNLVGKLITVRRTGSATESALKNICPKCSDPTLPEQFYICPNHTDKYKSGDLDKAKKVGQKLIRVDKGQAQGAKESSLPLNVLDLTIHPAAEVEAQTYGSANAYLFIPNLQNKQYGVLVDIIKSSPYAFIGPVNIKHHETLVRLTTWQGFLVVQQLLYPEDLSEVDVPQYEHSADFVATLQEFVAKNVKEFSAEDYKNDTKLRMAQLVEATASGQDLPEFPKKQITEDDIALANLKSLLKTGS